MVTQEAEHSLESVVRGHYVYKYGRRKKSSHLPFVQQDGQYRAISVPFPFNFCAVAVLVRFQTVPVLSQGQPVRSSEQPGWRNYNYNLLLLLLLNALGH